VRVDELARIGVVDPDSRDAIWRAGQQTFVDRERTDSGTHVAADRRKIYPAVLDCHLRERVVNVSIRVR
jgi:hypothetical protein